jgi:serine protease
VRLADGFSMAEKFLTLSGGTARAQRTAGLPNGADVSQVVGTRVARLAPGDSTTVTFAVLVAPTLAQLQASADAATAAYATLLPARAATAAAGFNVYPNPAAGRLRVGLPVRFGSSTLWLTNALGQTVLKQTSTETAIELNVLRAQGMAGVLTRNVVVR